MLETLVSEILEPSIIYNGNFSLPYPTDEERLECDENEDLVFINAIGWRCFQDFASSGLATPSIVTDDNYGSVAKIVIDSAGIADNDIRFNALKTREEVLSTDTYRLKFKHKASEAKTIGLNFINAVAWGAVRDDIDVAATTEWTQESMDITIDSVPAEGAFVRIRWYCGNRGTFTYYLADVSFRKLTNTVTTTMGVCPRCGDRVECKEDLFFESHTGLHVCEECLDREGP